MTGKENIRNTKPLSLAPLTPEEALRRAMQATPPKETLKSSSPAKRTKRRDIRKGK